jgi:DNA repair protein RadC
MRYEKINIIESDIKLHVSRPADLALFMMDKYKGLKQEMFFTLSLNTSNNVIAIHIDTIGLIDRTQIAPRECFYSAIKDFAKAIILVHNHPSGECSPSREDKAITDILVKAGNIIGIKVLDHIIFSDCSFYSFLEHGLIEFND